MKFYLFCNIDSPQIYDGLIPIDQVNTTLKQYIDGVEKFSYVFDAPVQLGNYELVRLTQKRSIKDDLEGREKMLPIGLGELGLNPIVGCKSKVRY